MLVAELVDDLAAVPKGVGLDVIAAGEPAGPAGVEGVEGAIQREIAEPPVARVGVVHVHRGEAPESVHVGDLHERFGAIDVGGVLELHARPAAEEVDLLEPHAGGVGAAAAAEVEARIEGPDIARRDAQVDLAVVIGHRADPGVVEIGIAAQDPLRLIDQAARIAFAGFEQELLADDVLAGPLVQVIRKPEELHVVLRILEVEHVLVVDHDLPDRGARGLELGIRWDPGGFARRPGGGPRRPGGRSQFLSLCGAPPGPPGVVHRGPHSSMKPLAPARRAAAAPVTVLSVAASRTLASPAATFEAQRPERT